MTLNQPLSLSFSRSAHVATPAVHPPALLSKGLNRLLSAAVISPQFQSLLLSNPAAALAAGYNGEDFQLTPAEYAAVTSLHASTIRDFAAQLLLKLQPATSAAPDAPKAQADLCVAEIAQQ